MPSARFLNQINKIRETTLDLPIFFCYKHIPSLKNLPSPAPNESLLYWFQGNFAASFVLKFCLREFLLSAFANRFELRCEPKRLMLLYYKICPCYCVHKKAKGDFQEKSCAYNERQRVNLKFSLSDFVYLIQKPSRRHYNSLIFWA